MNRKPKRLNYRTLLLDSNCDYQNFRMATQTTTITTMKMECLIAHLFHLYLMIRTINIILFNVNLQKQYLDSNYGYRGGFSNGIYLVYFLFINFVC